MIRNFIAKHSKESSSARQSRLGGESKPAMPLVPSNILYMERLPSGISEYELRGLLKSCDPVEIDLATGVLRFLTAEQADRAFTLFNDTRFKNGISLQLRTSPLGGPRQEPEARSGILQIRQLPLDTTNNLLYTLFRPFGLMSLCKIIMDQNQFKGTALIRYFDSRDTSTALHYMNNKYVQGNYISVAPFVSKKSQPTTASSELEDPKSPSGVPMPINHSRSPASSMRPVDYTNLYIKNLDLAVDSFDLYNHFSPYGRIVSARVMRNSKTTKSKGFGFVSFGAAEDAARALHYTNHTYIKSKPIVVAFHEPKKPRALSQSGPTTSTVTAQYPQAYPPSELLLPFASSVVQTPPPLQTSAVLTTASAGGPPHPLPRQRSSAAAFFHHHQQQQQQQQQQRRSHSPESRASSSVTDAQTQRLRLVDAVLQCGETREAQDVVDMLLTLKPKNRSLCLFNRDYLRGKIKEAKIALETCKDVDDEIDKLLASMQGLAVQEQKQRLGDRLFPCVKETGVRHAPRVTIRLLDTIPINELAYAMKDNAALKQRINQVVMSMQQQQRLRFAF